MDDSLLVRRLEADRDLSRDRNGFIEWHWPGRDAVRHRRPLDQLEHERAETALGFEAVNGRDVRVIERGQDLCFPLKPRQTGVERGGFERRGRAAP